ncbi:MAG TPA: CRISPR-associated protein Cas4 [Pyrinomonadaceae bacterium]|jgi:CRISPR-associated exonuclease Cas4
MIYLLLSSFILFLIALSAYLASRRAARRTGLPSGRLIYSDTGNPVATLGPIIESERGVKQERPLVSPAYGLTGRPDYLVQTSEGIVPVEAKSTKCPANGRPYDSHIMQLVAYCLLVESAIGAEVPYGVIKYSDREIIIDYTEELRDELITLLEEMREARRAKDVHRSHEEAQRCYKCSMRGVCTESLA